MRSAISIPHSAFKEHIHNYIRHLHRAQTFPPHFAATGGAAFVCTSTIIYIYFNNQIGTTLANYRERAFCTAKNITAVG